MVNLSKHPQALKDSPDRKALIAAEKEVEKNLSKLEQLKPRIKKRYERYTQLMRDRQSRKQSEISLPTEPRDQIVDPALSGVAKPLEASENRDLAVRLAQSELTRRATARRTKEQGDGDVRRVAGVWGDWEDALKTNERGSDDVSQQIQNIGFNMGTMPKSNATRQQSTAPDIPPRVSSAYKYPTVPRQNALESFVPPARIAIHDKNAERQPPPVLPPKELIAPSRASFVDGTGYAEAPPLPSKISSTPPVPDKAPLPEDNSTPSNLDPSSYTFKPSAYLENGSPLRSVFLPANLRSQFLACAAANTRRNLETCGILCGTLVSNALFISRLIIPEQTSTSDTCETTNESAIFEYCDSEDLLMLGWIHTHPSQTCFMSSRDLHTHCGYQVMLPESIAIVCAPSKNPDWGVFRLTDPPGLKTVLNCTQTGLFHPHAETNIYTGALRPGHVFEVNKLEFETVDLRPKDQRG